MKTRNGRTSPRLDRSAQTKLDRLGADVVDIDHELAQRVWVHIQGFVAEALEAGFLRRAD
jgi:hypothetical protein